METTADDIARRVESHRLNILDSADMERLLPDLEVVRRFRTLGYGDLTEATYHDLLLVIEQPADDEYAVRRFADHKELEQFVERRLAQYERMWDGSGCRIDFYERH